MKKMDKMEMSNVLDAIGSDERWIICAILSVSDAVENGDFQNWQKRIDFIADRSGMHPLTVGLYAIRSHAWGIKRDKEDLDKMESCIIHLLNRVDEMVAKSEGDEWKGGAL